MKRLFASIEKHNKLVLAVVGILTIAFACAVPRLELDTDYMALLPENPEQKALQLEVFGPPSEYNENFFFLLEGDKLFEPETLSAIDKVLGELSGYEQLQSPLSPFSFVTIEKKGSRLATVPMSPHQEQNLSWTEEEAEQFRKRVLSDDIVRNLLASEDGEAMLFFYNSRPLGQDADVIIEAWKGIVHQLDPYVDVYINGTPLLTQRLGYYLSRDLTILLGLCLLVILVIYYLSFRAKRAVLIPFSLSIIGMIWTLGSMVFLGYKLTIVNIITPCMVLILGSSYSIHVISEYYNVYKIQGIGDIRTRLNISLSTISKTILTACLTTVVGFLSLLVCKMTAFKELGISVSLGIVYCAILSITYIPALLANTVPPQEKQMQVFKNGLLTKVVNGISKFVVKYSWICLLLLAAIIGGFFAVKDEIGIQTNYMSYFPQKDPFIQDSIHMSSRFGGSDPHYITLTAPAGEKNYFYRPEVIRRVYEFEQAIIQNPDVLHILSFPQYVAFMQKVNGGTAEIPESPGLILTLSRLLAMMRNTMGASVIDSMINQDASRITLAIRSYDSVEGDMPTVASAARLLDDIEQYKHLLPAEVTMENWGDTSNGLTLTNMIIQDQNYSTLLSFILVFLIVCILFKSFKYGFCSIIPILTGVMANYILMFLLNIKFDVVTAIFASVTVGVGVDDAIHFMLRYLRQKKLHPTLPYYIIMQRALQETGRPIILTSMSIISGMLMLTFASYAPIRYFGLLLAIALFTTTLATLFILPSTMLVGHKVRELFIKKRSI